MEFSGALCQRSGVPAEDRPPEPVPASSLNGGGRRAWLLVVNVATAPAKQLTEAGVYSDDLVSGAAIYRDVANQLGYEFYPS